MKIYDEENMPYDDGDDDMAGYTFVEDNSIFKLITPEVEPETIASPIPENESTVILDSPSVAGIADGAQLSLEFSENGCTVKSGARKIGALKPAYLAKLKQERAGQKATVFYKKTTPPMVRLVFGDKGTVIPE